MSGVSLGLGSRVEFVVVVVSGAVEDNGGLMAGHCDFAD